MALSSLFFTAICARAESKQPGGEAPAAKQWAHFSSFSYSGTDPFSQQLAAGGNAQGKFLNPVLAGFYPDPSVCRVGDDYYLVNSSFSYYPGLPVFHSRDLVHWKQIGFALTRPADLAPLEDRKVSEGIYAPAIRYHNGLFYIITTLIQRGNFYITAKDPAGPWSEPVWLNEINGMDPSLFFDDDGTAYVMHCGVPEGQPLYEGHRAIRMRKLDLAQKKLVGEEKILVNGGVDIAKKPVWIEGPHLLKRDGVYWLIAAEGGTGDNHSEVAFRSDKPWGPYTPVAGNPILTQRDLGPRPDPVTCAGHADFVQTAKGDWWAVFLGCRPYERGWYNTGRETFLLPVSWAGGAPSILKPGLVVPRVLPSPDLPAPATLPAPLTGTFNWTDHFTAASLAPRWQFLRVPQTQWWRQAAGGGLDLEPRPIALNSEKNPSLIACRQQHSVFTAATAVTLPTDAAKPCDAGIVAFQNEDHWIFFGVRVNGKKQELILEQCGSPASARPKGKKSAQKPVPEQPRLLATAPLPQTTGPVSLKIESSGRWLSFSSSVGGGAFTTLKTGVDANALSTDVAGGFQGVMIGMCARN